jgi:SAM-dependent methyltransferase
LNNINPILLPGTEKQLRTFSAFSEPEGKNILVMGTGTESVAEYFAKSNNVIVIVEDQDNLMQLRFITAEMENVSVRMMEFNNMDFRDEKFDIVFAQASITTTVRNKIVKEVKRILKKDGIFCAGELVNLNKNIPPFVNDVWEHSSLAPMLTDELNGYYSGKGFEVIQETDLSDTLEDFYSRSAAALSRNREKLSEDETVYYKKVLKKIRHESNVYLRLGGRIYMGYKMLILRKV